MVNTIEVKPPGPGYVNAAKSVEMAVRRLSEAGISREEALTMINDSLYNVLGILNLICLGNTSILRQMSLAAATKLNAIKVAVANEEDARDGI